MASLTMGTGARVAVAQASSSRRMSATAAPSKAAVFQQFSGLRVSAAPASTNALSLKTAARPVGLRQARLSTVCRSKEAGVGVMGNKAGMTTVFTTEGLTVPVTVIALQDGNIVTKVKTTETDGYNSVQIGYKNVTERKLKKPELGHLQKAGISPLRYLCEFKVDDVSSFSVGQALDIGTMFKEGDLVDVAGTSIGKGFQGGIKRYHFHRGLMTHGSKSHRAPGSIGASATPSRVYPGRKMAGQMGNVRVKVRKLEVVRVDTERKCLVVKGAVPGKPGNLLKVTPAKIVGKNI